MKQIKCEMCGGTDLINQNGIFICQSCGNKYSTEGNKSNFNIDVSEKVNKWRDLMIDAFINCDFRKSRDYGYKILEKEDDIIAKYIINESHETIMAKCRYECFGGRDGYIAKRGKHFVLTILNENNLNQNDIKKYSKLFNEFSKHFSYYIEDVKYIREEDIKLIIGIIMDNDSLLKMYNRINDSIKNNMTECKKYYEIRNYKETNQFIIYANHIKKYYNIYSILKKFLISKEIVSINRIENIDDIFLKDILAKLQQCEENKILDKQWNIQKAVNEKEKSLAYFKAYLIVFLVFGLIFGLPFILSFLSNL